MNHVVVGQIDKQVVVGFTPLQETLATGDVCAESRHGVPLRVLRTHIDGGVELPRGPWIVLRRVAGSVEKHVIDAGHEHQVEVGFALTERRAEMFGEPGEGLARDKAFTSDVCGRRGVFQHREVRVVFLGEAAVGAQAIDAEIAEAKSLAFRNIDGSIDVNEVGWRTVCLVARDAASAMGPVGPLTCEILQRGEQRECQGLEVCP